MWPDLINRSKHGIAESKRILWQKENLIPLTFMQSGKGDKYLNAFVDELRTLDIPVIIVGEERYSLCNTDLSV